MQGRIDSLGRQRWIVWEETDKTSVECAKPKVPVNILYTGDRCTLSSGERKGL